MLMRKRRGAGTRPNSAWCPFSAELGPWAMASALLQHSMATLAVLFALDGCLATSGVGGRPALGFNNCNVQCCNETMPSMNLTQQLGLNTRGVKRLQQ